MALQFRRTILTQCEMRYGRMSDRTLRRCQFGRKSRDRAGRRLAAHLRTSSAIGPSQSASNVCEGPIAVMTSAIDPV